MESTKSRGAASAVILACSMVLASGMAPPADAPRAVAPADVHSVDVHGAPLTALGVGGVVGMGGVTGDRYGLGVVPLPPPPMDKTAADAVTEDDEMNVVGCPQVRAVVLGESSEDSFAVVGDRLLHRGQALSLGGSRLVVQDLAAKQVTFVRGDPAVGAGPASVVRCALQNYR